MAWDAAVVGIVQMGMSLMQADAARKTAAMQKRMAELTLRSSEQNVEIITANNAEEQYRLQKQQSMVYSEAIARAAASGVEMDGSTSIYLKDLRDTQQHELDWLRNVGQQAVRQEQLSGIFAYAQAGAGVQASKSAYMSSLVDAGAAAYGTYSQFRTSGATTSVTANTGLQTTGFSSTGDYSLGSSISGNWWAN